MSPSTDLPRLSAIALACALALPAALPAQETEAEAEPAEAAEAAEAPAEAEAAAEEPAEPEADPLAGLSAETVIAVVGDYELTLGELIAVRQQLPEQYQALPPEVLKDGLLEQLVNQTALALRARSTGLADTKSVQAAVKNMVNSTLADRYVTQEMLKRVTPEALEAEYERRYAEAEPVPEINAAHILVESQELAAELRAEIEGGTEFAEVAREHGTDGTASRGGDLGWFVASDMVPEFAEAAFALEPGTLSEPVETAFGWHLILVKERRERAAPPLEEVREELVRGLAEEAQQAIVAEAREAVEIRVEAENLPAAAITADGLLAETGGE